MICGPLPLQAQDSSSVGSYQATVAEWEGDPPEGREWVVINTFNPNTGKLVWMVVAQQIQIPWYRDTVKTGVGSAVTVILGLIGWMVKRRMGGD